MGGKALLYFELVSTLALAIGLVVAHVVKPGAGFHVDPATLDVSKIADYTTRAHGGPWGEVLSELIPATLIDPFAHGDVLQILLLSLLFGFALMRMGHAGQRLAHGVDMVGKAVFAVVNLTMKLAPIGAFGAMAFTVGRYGLASLAPMAKLIGSVYLTSALFIVLGLIARAAGFSLFRLLRHLQDELLVVLATSSSESALPRLMQKLEGLGCSRPVVPSIPVAGMTLILGIDRFMSECRSLTNFIGNAVATIVVSRWEGELDRDQLAAGLAAAAPMASAPAIERVPSD